MNKNRALLIGIDEYQNTRYSKLTGCVQDVTAVSALLETHADGDPNFECRALISGRDTVTRKLMVKEINKLLSPGPDVALFYYAGHGVGLPSDVSLVSADGDDIEPGVPLSLLLGKAQESRIEQIIIILDACHSGGGGGSSMLGSDIAVLRKGVALLAAAQPGQIAGETACGRGEFSTLLCSALEGGAADLTGKVSIAGIYAYLADAFGAWGQQPTFKANLEESFSLRHAVPLVPLDDLRRLTQFFKAETSELPLDPTYLGDSATSVPKNVADYNDVFTEYRDAELIEFIGTNDLRLAALQSKSCLLTARGRHYWRLVEKKRL